MTKNEYIELLRFIQNNLKNENNENNEIFNKVDSYDYVSDLEAITFESLIKSFILIFCMEFSYYKLDNKVISILLGSISLFNFFKYLYFNKISSDFRENYILICNIHNQNKKEISKLENAIEFFQSSSEEEIQKYLSYKMGDSKKIN